jgi:peptide/nickel transport system substrate-binding protein
MSQNAKLASTQLNDPCPWSLSVNTKNKPWDDPEMRWALNEVIHKDQFSALFNNPAAPTPARSTFPEYGALASFLDANASLFTKYPTTEYNLDKASQVFTAKGYAKSGDKWTKDGKPLTVKLSIFNAAALGAIWTNVEQLLVQDLTDAGLTVDSQAGDFGVVADARTAGNFDIQSWFECGSVADPWATLNRYAGPKGSDNPGGWDNKDYNAKVAKIGTLPPGDPQVVQLASDALGIFLKELPVIPMAQRPEPFLTNTTYWSGWPTTDNPSILAAWTMSFHQVVIKLTPAQ